MSVLPNLNFGPPRQSNCNTLIPMLSLWFTSERANLLTLLQVLSSKLRALPSQAYCGCELAALAPSYLCSTIVGVFLRSRSKTDVLFGAIVNFEGISNRLPDTRFTPISPCGLVPELRESLKVQAIGAPEGQRVRYILTGVEGRIVRESLQPSLALLLTCACCKQASATRSRASCSLRVRAARKS